MKIGEKVEWSKKKRIPHAPLRTLSELAAEFGVSSKTLQGKLANSKDAPRPVLDGRNNAHRATWYNHAEVRKWWVRMTSNV